MLTNIQPNIKYATMKSDITLPFISFTHTFMSGTFCTYVCMYVYIYTHICTYVCMYVRMYVCVYIPQMPTNIQLFF